LQEQLKFRGSERRCGVRLGKCRSLAMSPNAAIELARRSNLFSWEKNNRRSGDKIFHAIEA